MCVLDNNLALRRIVVLPSTGTRAAQSLLCPLFMCYKGHLCEILICHSPSGVRAVTDNLQRLVGVLAAEVGEEAVL